MRNSKKLSTRWRAIMAKVFARAKGEKNAVPFVAEVGDEELRTCFALKSLVHSTIELINRAVRRQYSIKCILSMG